jgi:predicted HicB family RNase H-like nuclease
VKKRATEPAEPKVKRMNLNVEVSLHNAFKVATAAQGTTMTDSLIEFIQKYVEKNYPAGLRKGRA